jgi:hypothetical protein
VSDFLAAGAHAVNKKIYTSADMVQYIGSSEQKSETLDQEHYCTHFGRQQSSRHSV